MNVTMTSKTEGDFHSVHKPLCENGGEHLHNDDKKFKPYEKQSLNGRHDTDISQL